MDTIDPTRFLFSFLFVIGLIGVLAMVLRRYGQLLQSGVAPMWISKLFGQGAVQVSQSPAGTTRLKIIEVRYLDPRRKLVLVRRDNAEHLLLLADGRELVIESQYYNSETKP